MATSTISRLKLYSIPNFKTGLNTSLSPHLIEKDAASAAKNMRFSLYKAEKTKGYEKFDSAALSGVPHIIDNYYLDDGTVHLMVITHTKAYKYNTGTSDFDDITGGTLTGTSDLPADSDIAFNKFYFTNNNNYPQFWDGAAGTIAVVPGLDTSVGSDLEGGGSSALCKVIKGFGNFLVLGNTTEGGVNYPSRVRWSKYGDPTVWINTAGAGQAGFADVYGVDQIVTMRKLKDYMVIYKERSIWLMQYVGSPAIFAFRRVIDGIGAIAPRAVAELTNAHIFIGPDGIYSFDGVGITSLSDRVDQSFFLQLNQSKLELMSALFIEEDYEVMFPFVGTNESVPSQALVYNYVTGSYGLRDLPATAVGYWSQAANLTWETGFGDKTWDEIDTYWDRKNLSADGPINLFGDSSGYIYKMNFVDTADGSDYEGYFVTKLMDFGEPDIIKRLQKIQPLVTREGNYNLQIYICAMDNPHETITFTDDPLTLNLSSGGASFVNCDISGRYFALKFRTASKDQPFRITALNLYYMERGSR